MMAAQAEIFHLIILLQRDFGQPLDVLVPLQTDDGDIDTQHVLKNFAIRLHLLANLDRVILYVPEILVQTRVDHDTRFIAADRFEHRIEWSDGSLEVDDLARQRIGPFRHIGLAAKDLDLDFVDIVLETEHHLTIFVDDLIDDAVEHGGWA